MKPDVQRNFLWKLHAALQIQPGDKLITPAALAQVVDPEYSRFKNTDEFKWPWIEDQDASIIPAANKTMDFFYLYDIPTGEMQLLSNNGSIFSVIVMILTFFLINGILLRTAVFLIIIPLY
jgi:hypothetical protein